MRNIGEVIRQTRIKKGFSREELEKVTKIKKEFIKFLEEEKWELLPEYPVIQGFIKNIATILKIDKKQVSALLRRDYPPQSLSINPKPDVVNKVSWSPKMTFFAGIVVATLLVLTYLGFQYSSFVRPPDLDVRSPQDGQIVDSNTLEVVGYTNPDVTIKVNNQPVLIHEDGFFSTKIEVFEGTEFVIVSAVSRSGKETVIRRKIDINFKK